MHGAGVLQLHCEQAHEHLAGPHAAVHKVAIEEDGVRRRGQARDLLQHVNKIEVLTVEVTNHGDFGALGDSNALQSFFLLQEVQDVCRHLVDILHGQLALLFIHGQQALHESIVHGAGPSILRPCVISGRLQAGRVGLEVLSAAAGLQSDPAEGALPGGHQRRGRGRRRRHEGAKGGGASPGREAQDSRASKRRCPRWALHHPSRRRRHGC
mmetsp:Transcript_104919/g.301667  ORF Transcript_104919/g.301667 Transcript_104919/m.301667 type:complete len:211 (-) Transcript_104919:15-647(-)